MLNYLQKNISRKTVVLLVVVLLLGLYVGPGQASLSAMGKNTDVAKNIKAETAALKARIESAKLVRANQDTYSERLEVARRAIPEDASLQTAISDLQSAAATAGVTWTSGAPSESAITGQTDATEGKSTTSAGLTSYTMSLRVVGSRDGITNFLGNISQTPRKITVQNASIEESSTGASSATVVVKLYTSSKGSIK